MFKRKTFNLVNEVEAKKRENLYEPKRCRWMKYIVIPAMIGFILLLILMNVDFSDRTKTELSTGTEILTTAVTDTTLMPLHSEQRARSYNSLPNIYTKIAGVAYCNDQGDDHCTIFCVNGSVNYLDVDLADRADYCRGRGALSVKLDNCIFKSQQLLAETFDGYFKLKSLEITNSDLVEIIDGAFKIKSMSTLTMLNLNTTAMTKLTEKSFEGLTVLQELKYLNVPSSSMFEGQKFLQPLAKTLQQVSLCQKSNTNIYNPLSWFDGSEKYSSLIRVDLSGNNFANNLSQATFNNLPAVRELIMADCSITELDVNTFAGITETLEYLDLSSNALKTLDVSVLTKKSGLRLELYGNAWSCSCENYELLKAVQASQFTYDKEPLCLTPPQWKDKPLKEVTINCDEEPPLTQEPPCSSTVKTPTTISDTSPSSTNTTLTSTIPVETPSTSLETTPSTTKTTVTPHSTVEPPTPSFETSSSITKGVTTPSSGETTTPTFETSSSTSAETEETEGNEDEKTTTVNITTPSTPPKPTPPKPPTPAPVDTIELVCHDYGTPTNYTISIRNFDARFIIRSTTSSSVVLLILNNMQQLRLIYFTAKNRTYVNTTEKSVTRNIPDSRRCERTSTSYTIIHVESLVSDQTYIFCLMPLEEQTISLFNCHSHYLEAESSSEHTAWLLTNDQAWFCILIIFGILLTLCLGLISVYWLLRWRPTWLRGCNRIIKADDALSHEVYLLPKSQRNKSEQYDSIYDKQRNLDENRANLSLDFDSYDYMQFYKDLQNANRNRKIHTLSSILPPKEQAPDVPQNQTRTVSLQSTIPADDLIERCEADDSNDYQSIDYYEQIL